MLDSRNVPSSLAFQEELIIYGCIRRLCQILNKQSRWFDRFFTQKQYIQNLKKKNIRAAA